MSSLPSSSEKPPQQEAASKRSEMNKLSEEVTEKLAQDCQEKLANLARDSKFDKNDKNGNYKFMENIADALLRGDISVQSLKAWIAKKNGEAYSVGGFLNQLMILKPADFKNYPEGLQTAGTHEKEIKERLYLDVLQKTNSITAQMVESGIFDELSE